MLYPPVVTSLSAKPRAFALATSLFACVATLFCAADALEAWASTPAVMKAVSGRTDTVASPDVRMPDWKPDGSFVVMVAAGVVVTIGWRVNAATAKLAVNAARTAKPAMTTDWRVAADNVANLLAVTNDGIPSRVTSGYHRL